MRVKSPAPRQSASLQHKSEQRSLVTDGRTHNLPVAKPVLSGAVMDDLRVSRDFDSRPGQRKYSAIGFTQVPSVAVTVCFGCGRRSARARRSGRAQLVRSRVGRWWRSLGDLAALEDAWHDGCGPRRPDPWPGLERGWLGQEDAVRVEVSSEAAEFVRGHGGRLWVWAARPRMCCQGTPAYMHAAMAAPAGLSGFVAVGSAGLDLRFRAPAGTLPAFLEIGLRGGRRPRVEAYWEGCRFVL
jgi:hypothetical protein